MIFSFSKLEHYANFSEAKVVSIFKRSGKTFCSLQFKDFHPKNSRLDIYISAIDFDLCSNFVRVHISHLLYPKRRITSFIKGVDMSYISLSLHQFLAYVTTDINGNIPQEQQIDAFCIFAEAFSPNHFVRRKREKIMMEIQAHRFFSSLASVFHKELNLHYDFHIVEAVHNEKIPPAINHKKFKD